MRDISATLLAAQKAYSGTPYIHLLFTSKDGGTTYDYSSDLEGRRILSIDHQEEPFNDYAMVVLRNNDRTIPALEGYWTEIGYGFVASGNEYSATPRLWVKHQQTVSSGGRLYDVLELEGMWAWMREQLIRIGNPPFYSTRQDELTYTTDTVYTIISAILAEVGFTLDALGGVDDGIIDTFTPRFDINDQPFEFAASIIYRLLNMTKCYLRPEASLEFKLVYPQTADFVNETYYSDQAHYFYSYIERANALVPNHIICFGNEGDDGMWTNYVSGEATDAAEIAAYTDVTQIVLAGTIDNDTDAANRAAVVLTRAKSEAMAGRCVVPHDCSVELYDKISVEDSRGT